MIVSQSDNSSKPLVISGVCGDISIYKTDNKIIDTITCLSSREMAKIVREDYYYPMKWKNNC